MQQRQAALETAKSHRLSRGHIEELFGGSLVGAECAETAHVAVLMDRLPFSSAFRSFRKSTALRQSVQMVAEKGLGMNASGEGT
jgi:hypothetical protein